ncbi:hypothetical protein PROFUN_08628 [Planoprotostelium fungivorum]|uniref:Uncharacterized protein n=1 Tax=Planoprotostelium fungivorum TaxID=1890364 RepID=A0A2P6NJ24_9EUKA|nr:hypothetical protein PROFUN_08628 [Planoprotostelium fungivorum]
MQNQDSTFASINSVRHCFSHQHLVLLLDLCGRAPYRAATVIVHGKDGTRITKRKEWPSPLKYYLHEALVFDSL